MGRIVSCKSCGQWAEVGPGENARDYVCAVCRGAAAADQPRSVRAEPVGAGASSPRPVPSIGGDSGDIGSTVGAVVLPSASDPTRRAEASAPLVPTIDTSMADEAIQRLAALAAQPPPPDSREMRELKSRGVETISAARAVVGEGADRARQAAAQFALDQARKTADEAAALVRDQGPRAIGQLDDFLKQQAGRVRSDAVKATGDELKKGADLAAEAARRKLSSLRPSRPPQQADLAGRCAGCNEPIVPGERVALCPTCGRRYHMTCYSMNGCVSASCRRGQASPQTPPMVAAAPPVPQAPVVPLPVARPAEPARAPITLVTERPATAPRRCTSCGAQVSRGSLVCPQCGRWLYSGRMTNDPRLSKRSNGSGCGTVLVLLIGVAAAMALWWCAAA